ncbi:hypothetical protein ACKQTC_08255 [Peptococcus simiae]|uniref:Uncharacterized protein n=1 Tax=Peptococcus simiae TaxID=1643805 RepID=A0ABW9H0H7_9FIRM
MSADKQAQEYIAYTVYEDGTTQAMEFEETHEIVPFLMDSKYGNIKTMQLKNNELAGLYIGWFDAVGKAKGRAYNEIGSWFAGLPIYGRLLIWRCFENKAMAVKRNDIIYLDSLAAKRREIMKKRRRPLTTKRRAGR